MTYTISTIASVLGLASPAHKDSDIDILLTDSRSLVYPERSLFFALRTATNDGHRYVEELYDRGVRNFVVDHIPGDRFYPEAKFLVVPDVTAALQKLAAHHRMRFTAPVIGITGSRGKTTVKEWLYQLLHDDYKVVRSPRSYNSQIGVPLSIWEMDDSTELSIFEAGISMPGEMAHLQAMVKPDIGIITNIGNEHQSGFESLAEKCCEKVMLLRDCNAVVFDADDELIASTIGNAGIRGHKLGISFNDRKAALYVSEVQTFSDHTRLTYTFSGVTSEVTVPMITAHEVRNALLCVVVMLYLGFSREVIASHVARIKPVGTRLDVVEGVNDCLIVHDSYTADFHSLAPALDFVERRHTAGRDTVVILSDVMHENMSATAVYSQIASLLQRRGISRFIGIGPEMKAYSKYFDVDARFFISTDDFLAEMGPGDFSHDLILVKGAPQFGFSRITEMLSARRYETVLDVNLDALVHNYINFKSRVRPETGVVCMLKASGYGAGSYELAKTLQQQGAAYLGVAVTDEGVDLRNAGITMPIMVLNPRVVNYKDLFAYNLEPEIYSFEIMTEIIREAEKYGISDYPVHIKLDTGMHRLGFAEADLPELHSRLLAQSAIRPATIFSHLATADCLDMDDYTLSQLELFDRCCNKLQQGFNYHIKRHILNTAGIIRFPEYQYDMVRLGIGLYGVPTLPPECNEGELRPVSSLRTVILSLKERHVGDTIGYSRRGRIERPSLIATCPVGYADGLNRHLGNGRMKVLVNGVLCPTVGNICMDICMIDVTEVPDVKTGDSVEIFGENLPVSDVATVLDTIPYEVLTSVSSRVKRVYYRE